MSGTNPRPDSSDSSDSSEPATAATADAKPAMQAPGPKQAPRPEQPKQPQQLQQPKQPKPPLPELLLPDAAAWHAWLETHHAASPGVQLVLGRKGGTATNLTYGAALLEALCFGWIDGQANRRDEHSYLQRFTPRTPRSMWSQRNVGFVAQLEAEGRMRPAGRAAVEQAKANGRWETAYTGSAAVTVPEDLLAAIAGEPRAQAMYEVLTAQNRYALVYRLNSLKTPAARERRIAAFVRMLAEGGTPYPQRRRAP